MEIRLLSRPERPAAIQLIWAAFLRYEAPDYSPEGIEAFRRFITDEASWDRLESFGAFEGGQLCGVIAVREHRTHIALFFVRKEWHRRGVGKALFQTMMADTPYPEMTVHASPYAVEVYRRLGFFATDAERTENGIRYTPMRYQGPEK